MMSAECQDDAIDERLEFQTKEDLRRRRYDLSAWNDVEHWFSSSGSTGAPVLYPWTSADQKIADATVLRAHAGLAPMPGATGLVIAPTGLPGMWHHMTRQLRSLGLATALPGTVPEHVFNLIEQLLPRVLISLPLVLSRLGELHARSGRNPMTGGFLFSGGDVLSLARQRRIEAMWGASVKNFYGLSEVFGPLASQQEDSGALAWHAEEVSVEILDPLSAEPVAPGETGVAVLTTLWDRPASLTRYWTGDCFRLLEWLAAGRPLFEMRGRETVRLPALKAEWFPVDVDQAVLSDPAAGNEWTVRATADEVLLIVECASGVEALDPRTLSAVDAMFDCPVRWRATELGSIDRFVPKLAVTREQQ
jgi:phenylacetate-CoA ligase